MFFRFAALTLLAALLAGCASLTTIVPGLTGASDELTIVYTGYARGNVDPQPNCD